MTYAIAFQAGRAFFNVILADGLNYAILGAIATAIGFILTYICWLFFDFEPGIAAVSKDANSSIPTIGYPGTYVFATIFSALACNIMAWF